MPGQRFQLSPYLRVVHDRESETALAYHTLYGNPRILNSEGIGFLDLFNNPTTIEEVSQACDANPTDIIREFADIFFLVDPNLDERVILRQKKCEHLKRVSAGETVDRMGLAISDSCNFKCSHCIHFKKIGDVKGNVPPHQKQNRQLNMGWGTAQKCVDRYFALMRQQGRNQCMIHFGNAEPLVNWRLIERILKYCDKIKDLTFEFTINSNLTLMTRDIAETLKKYRVRIATSLDGTLEANDAIRVTKTGLGTFDRIIQKFDLLAQIEYPLDGFSITVTDRNFNLIDTDIIDLAVQRGMKSIAFDYDLTHLAGISVAARVTKLIRLKKYANKRGIDFFGTWDSTFRNLTNESLLTGNHAFCAAVEGKSLEFNTDGSIKVCSHTRAQIGHVDRFDHVFKDVNGLSKVVGERFPCTDKRCIGCTIEGPCGGQCQVTREVAIRLNGEEKNGIFNDMCNFYRSMTDALIEEYLRSNRDTAIINR